MNSLPIDTHITSIIDAVKKNQQVILTATPGAGKTTRLPPHLLSTVQGKVAVLQPRRMAAISACQFVADENQWQVGEQVGYQVRQDSKFNINTKLLFMTDAILLRRLIDDPELNEFGLIVIDEFHERNLNQDVILGVLKELQLMGRDIRILIMSATLDLKEFKKYLSESVVIDVPGAVYPLEIQYSSKPLSLQTDYEFIQRVASAITSFEANKTTDDILVFLPGVGEIQRLREALLEKKIQREVVILHGSLNLKDQQVVLRKHEQRRVILATNIAEASVTVSGVNAVIDSGLARVLTTNLNSGFSILNLTAISKFNAKQRSGRAAREKSGTCLRLWTVHEESSRDEQLLPEVQRLDLTSTLLLLSHLGITDPKSFSWFSIPQDGLLNKSSGYLKNIGALTESGSLTDLGQSLLSYPIEPRLGSLLFLIEQELRRNHDQDFEFAFKIISILQDKDFLTPESNLSSASESDLLDRLQLLEDYETKNLGRIRLNQNQIKNIFDSSKQLKQIVDSNLKLKSSKLIEKIKLNEVGSRLENKSKEKSSHNFSEKNDELQIKEFLKFLLLTQSDRLCRRRTNSNRGLMVGGRGVKLSPNSSVHKSEFFVSLSGMDLPGQAETTINMAHGYTKIEVIDILKDQIQNIEEPFYDPDKGQFYLKKLRRFKDLDLDEPTLTKISADDLGDKFLDILVLRWPDVVKAHSGLNNWMSRWKFFCDESQADLKLSSEMIRSVLEMASSGRSNWDEIIKQDLVYFIQMQLDPKVLKSFNELTPKEFHAPSGGVHQIVYSDSESPFVEVRLQEVFGLTETPRLGPLKKSLVFKLLAPNFRPVQVTSDIAGFWQRSYVDVKKELKGRYPKHSWPDDPLTAQPVQKGRRRS